MRNIQVQGRRSCKKTAEELSQLQGGKRDSVVVPVQTPGVFIYLFIKEAAARGNKPTQQWERENKRKSPSPDSITAQEESLNVLRGKVEKRQT